MNTKMLDCKPFKLTCQCGEQTETTLELLQKRPLCSACGYEFIDQQAAAQWLQRVQALDSEISVALGLELPGSLEINGVFPD